MEMLRKRATSALARLPSMVTAITVAIMGLSIVSATDSLAQSYPTKPIHIVTAGAGGSSDISSRLIANGISAALGQPVIVDNKSGLLAIQSVAQAAPDGYTFLYYGSVIWTEPMIREDAGWDPIRDFAPVVMALRAPNVLAVHPSLPVKSVAELIALAKAKPGELNFAAATIGSSTHLAGELFKYMAKVNIEQVLYKDTTSALTDVLGGRVQMIFSSPLGVAEYLRSGQLKALAVTSAEPTPLAPGLPTVAASGVPGYEYETVEGLFAPAGTPEAYIKRINQEVVRYLQQPDVKERYFKSGVEVVAGPPQQMTDTMKTQMQTLGKLIKDANIHIK